MALISSDATTVDFGTVARGQHNSKTVAIRPVAVAEMFSQIALFLENNGGLDHTVFGKFKSATPIAGIEPGDPRLSDYFVQAPGVSDFSAWTELSDYGLELDAGTPEYVWIDAEAGTSETNLGDTTINLRFVFEYV
jgi:hypothetical protein